MPFAATPNAQPIHAEVPIAAGHNTQPTHTAVPTFVGPSTMQHDALRLFGNPKTYAAWPAVRTSGPNAGDNPTYICPISPLAKQCLALCK